MTRNGLKSRNTVSKIRIPRPPVSHRSAGENSQHVSKQDVTEIHSVSLDGADQGHTQRQRRRKQDPDRRVFLDRSLPREETDAQRDHDRRGQCTYEQIPVQQVSDGDTGQNGMRQRITHEGHATQYDVRAHDRTQHPHHHARREGAQHKGVLQGLKK